MPEGCQATKIMASLRGAKRLRDCGGRTDVINTPAGLSDEATSTGSQIDRRVSLTVLGLVCREHAIINAYRQRLYTDLEISGPGASELTHCRIHLYICTAQWRIHRA